MDSLDIPPIPPIPPKYLVNHTTVNFKCLRFTSDFSLFTSDFRGNSDTISKLIATKRRPTSCSFLSSGYIKTTFSNSSTEDRTCQRTSEPIIPAPIEITLVERRGVDIRRILLILLKHVIDPQPQLIPSSEVF